MVRVGLCSDDMLVGMQECMVWAECLKDRMVSKKVAFSSDLLCRASAFFWGAKNGSAERKSEHSSRMQRSASTKTKCKASPNAP